MGQHTHDESESASGGDHLHRWSAPRMLRHLRDVHGLNPPMAWDIGRLHQAHLEDHQKAAGTLPQSIPTQQPTEATMTIDTARERRARALYEEDIDGYGPQPAWDDLGQETRDSYRDRAKNESQPIQTCGAVSHGLICQLSAGHSPVPAQDPVDGEFFDHLDNRDGLHFFNDAVSEGQRRILLDKIICAMSGIDFDGIWVKDESLPLRGAIRTTYEHQAHRLLIWLERGGAMELPAFVTLMDERNAEGRARIDAERRQGELSTQLELLSGDLEAVTAERDQALSAFDQMNAQRVETETELREQLEGALTSQRLLQEANDGQIRARNELAVEVNQANALALLRRTERDEARQTANRFAAEAAELRDELTRRNEEAGELRRVVATLEGSSLRHIPLPGQGTDVADTIGRARAAVELRKAGKHFMAGPVLLFTKDAVRNILGVLADQLEKTT